MRSDSDHCLRNNLRCHPDVAVLDVGIVLIAASTYAANVRLRPTWSNWFTSGYLNDILAGLMLAGFVDYLLVRGGTAGLTTFSRVVTLIIPAGIFWEYATPLYRPQSTSDPLDLLAYAIGALLFLICRQVLTPDQEREAVRMLRL